MLEMQIYAANLEDASGGCSDTRSVADDTNPKPHKHKEDICMPVTAAAKGIAKTLLHSQSITTGSLCMVSSAIWVITVSAIATPVRKASVVVKLTHLVSQAHDTPAQFVRPSRVLDMLHCRCHR